MEKSPSAVFQALLSEDDGPETGIPGRPTEVIRAAISAGDQHRAGAHLDESVRDADLASMVQLGSKVWEGDGVEVTPEVVLKNLLGDLFVEDSLLSDVRELGEGGFATVQSAHLTHPNGMKQLVAIKRLRPERLCSEDSLTEFIAEANLWRKLQSKDIVKLMGVGAVDTSSVRTIRSTFFIVCEFMEGGTLRTIVQRQQMSKHKDVYSAHDVFRWFVAITRAVKYLHSCRPAIIHRDMKPENVLLTSTDSSCSDAKVLDLGLHIRGRASRQFELGSTREESYYGGSTYDAVAFNGSVYAGTRGRFGMSLADKVRQVEATSPLVPTASPPHTNTRHGSVTGDNQLMPISEEQQDDSAIEALVSVKEPPAVEQAMQAAPADSASGALTTQRTPTAGTDAVELHPAAAQARLSMGRSDVSVASKISHQELHTSKVGSWLYMAPEMVTSHQYTEKVDVFSIGVMLFEALRGRLNVTKLAITHDPGSLQDYAESVADGFREDIPSNWPEEVSSLIRDSWHQDPDMRITAAEFLTRVSNLMNSDVARAMDEARKASIYTGDCSCGCSVM